jgi:hypothetical protein
MALLALGLYYSKPEERSTFGRHIDIASEDNMKTLREKTLPGHSRRPANQLLAILMAILVSVTFNLIAVDSAEAQRCGDRVQTELERTTQILENVRDKIVSISNSVTAAQLDRARSLMTIAVTVQGEAIKSCGAGHPLLAMRLTKEARDKAHAALGAVNTRDENESVVVRRLEKTDELLARVREHVDSPVTPEMRARFERAQEMQRRAWELYRSGNPLMALKLTREVDRTVRDLIKNARIDERLGKSLERQYENISNRLANLRDEIADCDNPRSAELLNKAENALKEARELYANEHFQQSKTALRLAGELGHKAQALCGIQERAGKRLETLIRRAARLEEQAAGNQQALKLIHAAQSNLSDAENLIADGLVRAATGQIKAAEMLLRQAKRLLGDI